MQTMGIMGMRKQKDMYHRVVLRNVEEIIENRHSIEKHFHRKTFVSPLIRALLLGADFFKVPCTIDRHPLSTVFFFKFRHYVFLIFFFGIICFEIIDVRNTYHRDAPRKMSGAKTVVKRCRYDASLAKNAKTTTTTPLTHCLFVYIRPIIRGLRADIIIMVIFSKRL